MCDLLQRKANDYLVVDNQFRVMNLKTQQPYEFRVVAHNAIGPSDHSLPSMAATPRDPAGMTTYNKMNGSSWMKPWSCAVLHFKTTIDHNM